MNPSDIVDGIRDYTGNGYGVQLDTLIIAQSMIYDIVGFILGLIAFFIVVGMALITTLDVAYITIPMFQDKVRDERWDGSKGHGKVRFISNDARLAVEQASMMSTGKSALWIYIKKRIIAYMICAVVLFICLRGSSTLVPIIANIILDLLKGFSRIHIVA